MQQTYSQANGGLFLTCILTLKSNTSHNASAGVTLLKYSSVAIYLKNHSRATMAKDFTTRV